MGQLAAVVAHHVQLQPLRVGLAVLARLQQLALPAAGALQLIADQQVLATRLGVAGKARGDLADHLFRAVPGDAAEGLVDRQQAVVGVEDDDALAGRLEHGGGQALFLLAALARADVAAGADHPRDLAAGVAGHHPAAVLDPHPVAVGVAHAVFDAVAVGAPAQVVGQGPAQQRHVVRMQQRAQVGAHAAHRVLVQAEDFPQARVVHLVGAQVPVPQPQLAGLQGHGQARLAVAQLDAAGLDPHLQLVARLAQGAFGAAALLDLAAQVLVEGFRPPLGLLQVVYQRKGLEAPQQAALDQPVDLPGHHQQGRQQDRAEQPPALLQIAAPEQQVADGRQQAGQGESQEGRQAHRVGDAGGKNGRGDQAEHQGLLQEGVGRHQGDGGEGQGQPRGAGAEEERPLPVRFGLALRLGVVEGGDLDQPHHRQQHQPHQPAGQQQAVLAVPEQAGAGQAVEQHEQGRHPRALIEQAGALDGQFVGVLLADLGLAERRGRGIQVCGHRRLFLVVVGLGVARA